ncbi:MAG TPA: AIR synthase-related protein [Actinomycetota bacterium]|nr:AIR synthase-related protein [Actinomycetota bacterium]
MGTVGETGRSSAPTRDSRGGRSSAPTRDSRGGRSSRLAAGKAPPDLLTELLRGFLPLPPEVRLGPAVGEDACALEVPGGALVVATDPITFTAEDVGRFAVVVNANDVAVTGARPRWFLSVVLVPPETSEEALLGVFGSMQDGLRQIGAHLVGGHTEATPAVTQPVVVGQMLGIAEAGRVVATGGARPGDVLVQVGEAPVEGAAVLAREAGARLRGLDPATVAAAREALERPGISVVEPALVAAGLGATSLHDPTEGGLAAGLHEVAAASRVRLVVDREAVGWFGPGRAVCEALGADPWATLASGALLAAFPPEQAEAAVRALADRGHRVAVVGRAEPGSGVVGTDGEPIGWPDRDEVARVLEGTA